MMKFAPKYFVGIKGDLGFATPDGTDAAARKRKKTVGDWAGAYVWAYDQNGVGYKEYDEGSFETFDNVPVSGFNLGKSVSRWSTSNKWFRISDPRGFDLEISAENLAELIQTSDILKGELQGKFVWMRNAATNYLVSENHESYLTRNDESQNTYKVQVGVPFMFDGKPQVYLGKFYVGGIAMSRRNKLKPSVARSTWGFRKSDYEYITEYSEFKDEKPVHVYIHRALDYMTKEYCVQVEFRRSKIPNKKCTASDDTWLTEQNFDLTDGFHDAYTYIEYPGGYTKRSTFSEKFEDLSAKLNTVRAEETREKLF